MKKRLSYKSKKSRLASYDGYKHKQLFKIEAVSDGKWAKWDKKMMKTFNRKQRVENL